MFTMYITLESTIHVGDLLLQMSKIELVLFIFLFE